MQPISPAVRDLQRLLGARNVLWQPDDLRVYSYDGSNNMASPDIVALPETAKQISEIIKLARRYSMAIVPRGSGTVSSEYALAGMARFCTTLVL